MAETKHVDKSEYSRLFGEIQGPSETGGRGARNAASGPVARREGDPIGERKNFLQNPDIASRPSVTQCR
ncbi:hypothetical protein ABTA57_19890, partial [Acinetobacter baumannii]